jgi:ribosome-associated protein
MPFISPSPSPDASGAESAHSSEGTSPGQAHAPAPEPSMTATLNSQHAPLSSSELSLRIADAAGRKKGENIVVLDLRGISTLTEFYVICSGSSEPQLKAIVDEIQDVLRKETNVRARRVDGFPYSQWVVADFGDVIVHVFHESKRQHYALEDLWSDAPRVPLPETVPPLSEVSH